MIKIERHNKIVMTRGDTAYLTVDIEGNYKKQEGDMFTISCKKKITDSEYAFQISFPVGTVLQLVPSDTKDLAFGRYVYDVQLDTVDGEVFTVVGPAEFRIEEEVTI